VYRLASGALTYCEWSDAPQEVDGDLTFDIVPTEIKF
jgi:hypothetical protein